MVLTFAERNVKQYALNRATGSERTSKMVDLAEIAAAECGFLGLKAPRNHDKAKAMARCLAPPSLQFTDAQWNHSSDMAIGAAFGNAPGDQDEMRALTTKTNPKTGKLGQWRIVGEVLRGDKFDWLPQAREARAEMRAHAFANAEAILARYGGPKSKLMSDEELAVYESCRPADSDEEEEEEEDEEAEDVGAAKENAGAARNKPAPKPAKKAAKAPSKKREREATAAAAASDDDDDFVRDEPKRKSVKKAEKAEKKEATAEPKAPKKPNQEAFYKAVSAMVDLVPSRSDPLALLLIRMGLDAPGAAGIDLRATLFNAAVSTGGSAALSNVVAQAELLLSYLRQKAAASGSQVPDGLEPRPAPEAEAAAA